MAGITIERKRINLITNLIHSKMNTKEVKLSWGYSPSDIKEGDTILVFLVGAGICPFLVPAQKFDYPGVKPARVKTITKFGGTWFVNTTEGEINLTGVESGLITFVK